MSGGTSAHHEASCEAVSDVHLMLGQLSCLQRLALLWPSRPGMEHSVQAGDARRLSRASHDFGLVKCQSQGFTV